MNNTAKKKKTPKPGSETSAKEPKTEETGLDPDAPPETHGPGPEEDSKPEPKVQPEPEPADHQLLRLRADFDNFRKRIQREKASWSQQAQVNLVEDLITVLDHFEMGLENAEQHEAKKAVSDGFKLVYEQFAQALQKHGLQTIDAEGQPFDPEVHEAISHLHSDEQAADIVLAQTRKGYKMGDRLIRAAQVVVSSGPGPAGAAEDDRGESRHV